MESKKLNSFKYIRLWKGLTVSQMAKILGISAGSISAVENEQRSPTPEIRAAYARAFPIDQSYFDFIEAFKKTST